MARERITFPVNLRQNTNDDSTAFGKWFPVPSTSEPMSLKGFAKHLAEHGKLASYDMLVLVLQNIVGCLKELILQGQSVKLDGLGTFRPTIEGKGSNDVETAVSLGANVIIEGIHLRFSPENAKGPLMARRRSISRRSQSPTTPSRRPRPRLEARAKFWQGFGPAYPLSFSLAQRKELKETST